jgi:hypothetical protein
MLAPKMQARKHGKPPLPLPVERASPILFNLRLKVPLFLKLR